MPAESQCGSLGATLPRQASRDRCCCGAAGESDVPPERGTRRSLGSRQARCVGTRGRILVGAIVLAKVEQGVLEESVLRGWLKGALSRPDDRALFGL